MSKENRRWDVHLNLNVRGLGQSATVAINSTCARLERDGKKTFRLGLGQSPFPVPRPVTEALQANAHQKDYLPTKGLWELRQAVADYHRRLDGLQCSGEDVMIAPGSKELMFLLQLVYYGDLLIPTPSWVSYAPQARMIGRSVYWLNTHFENDWKLTADELDSFCRSDSGRPRILILNYPSNPTGATFSSDELEQIAQAARKHKVILLSDEIYGELNHLGKHQSIARYYPEGTIVSSGLSKWCGAGGWRLGTFVFPTELRWLLDSMSAAASETYTSTSAPIQYAAIRAFDGGTVIGNYLWSSRAILSALGGFLWKELSNADLRMPEPAGGFYLFPDFEAFRQNFARRGILTSQQLCDKLLEETGVAILPGSVFGRPENELTARLAYVDFDGARALTALAEGKLMLDQEFLNDYCPNMVEASRRIISWLS